MIDRGDRQHDIAAWFGLNQGRIKDTENGKYGLPPVAPEAQLPPSGAPGLKGRALRDQVRRALQTLSSDPATKSLAATGLLKKALADFDKNE